VNKTWTVNQAKSATPINLRGSQIEGRLVQRRQAITPRSVGNAYRLERYAISLRMTGIGSKDCLSAAFERSSAKSYTWDTKTDFPSSPA